MIGIAVLSGGLDQFEVNAEARHQRLEWLLRELGARYGGQTAFVGDGFQLGLRQPLAVCECALFIRAGLLAVSPSRRERWDVAISMAVGSADSPRGEEGVYGAARRGLDELERGHLAFHADWEPVHMALSLATAFVDDVLNHWTPSEAEAYFEHLRVPGGHKNIAQRLRKSRPTITKTLLRAKYNLLDRYRRDAQMLMKLNQA